MCVFGGVRACVVRRAWGLCSSSFSVVSRFSHADGRYQRRLALLLRCFAFAKYSLYRQHANSVRVFPAYRRFHRWNTHTHTRATRLDSFSDAHSAVTATHNVIIERNRRCCRHHCCTHTHTHAESLKEKWSIRWKLTTLHPVAGRFRTATLFNTGAAGAFSLNTNVVGSTHAHTKFD